MKLALDVHYDDDADIARVAGVVFRGWADATPTAELVHLHRGLAPYVPGEFYKRELPCLMPLVMRAQQRFSLDTIVVDSYVDLGDAPGMGRYLFDALEQKVRVIGVAKSRFRDSVGMLAERGSGDRPLFITATDDLDMCHQRILWMHGDHRIPTLLKWVDHLARGLREPQDG